MAVLELDKEQIYRLALQLTAQERKEIARQLLSPEPAPPVRRVPGRDKGRVWIAPDFNAPLPADIEDSFYS